MADKNTTHYELSVGAIAMLAEVLAMGQWYKDDKQQAVLMGRGFAAHEALPDLPKRPKPAKDESKEDYDDRIEEWAKPVMEFEWTDKQKEAVKTCVKFFLKQGAFSVTKHTMLILKLLGLTAEEAADTEE